MREATVLIATRQDAREVDGVIDILRENGLRVVRWNTCQFPEHFQLSWSGAPFSPLSVFDGSVPSAGWIHPQANFSITGSLDGLAREVALSECQSFYQGVLFSLPCRWLNSPCALITASNKIFQLQKAASLDIKVPPYLFTNDPQELLRFETAHGSCVLKALSKSYWQYCSREFKTYTRRLSEYRSRIEESLRFGPVFIQREIMKRLELRITVVGDRAFTVSLDRASGDIPNVVDIRELNFKDHQNSFSYSVDWPEIEESSKQLVRELGLSYAGLDWVVDESCEPYFLECNPLGSFKWYEICGAEGLSQAIAEKLLELASW